MTPKDLMNEDIDFFMTVMWHWLRSCDPLKYTDNKLIEMLSYSDSEKKEYRNNVFQMLDRTEQEWEERKAELISQGYISQQQIDEHKHETNSMTDLHRFLNNGIASRA